MNRLLLIILALLCCVELGFSQNIISVPFPNGFIGINTGNNSAGSAYYLSGAQGVGWSNVRFAQTTNGTVFVTQGNDIVGTVLITDNAGVTHEIPGFIKWRAPSGNNPHTMVFQPAPGTFVLTTNGFNGSSTYTIDENKYIGLTKAGATLTISPVPGTVSGNASTSGLLDALNTILGDLPQLYVTGTTVLESDGIANVTVDLSTSATQTVSTYFRTYSETALAVDDYDSTSILVSFSPGETQKIISIPITVDAIDELDEYFMVRIFESTNAAITNSEDSVWITENTLPVEFLGATVQCQPEANILTWSTASEHDSYAFEIEKSTNAIDWNFVGSHLAQGNTNQITEYDFKDFRDCATCQSYYRIKQIDLNGKFEYLPILLADCEREGMLLYPNPAHEKASISLNLNRDDLVHISIIDVTGKPIKVVQMKGQQGQNTFQMDIRQIQRGSYLIQVNTSTDSFIDTLQITK